MPALAAARMCCLERRGGVPGAGQPVAFSGVAVAVDDHGCIAKLVVPGAWSGRRGAAIASARANAPTPARSSPRWATATLTRIESSSFIAGHRYNAVASNAGGIRLFVSNTNCTIQSIPLNFPRLATCAVTYAAKVDMERLMHHGSEHGRRVPRFHGVPKVISQADHLVRTPTRAAKTARIIPTVRTIGRVDRAEEPQRSARQKIGHAFAADRHDVTSILDVSLRLQPGRYELRPYSEYLEEKRSGFGGGAAFEVIRSLAKHGNRHTNLRVDNGQCLGLGLPGPSQGICAFRRGTKKSLTQLLGARACPVPRTLPVNPAQIQARTRRSCTCRA